MARHKKPKRPPVSCKRWAEQRAETAMDPLLFDATRRIWGMPQTTESTTATFTIWRTLDNAYMVCRVVSKLSDDHRFNVYRSVESEQFLGGMGSKEAWDAAGNPKKIVRHDVPIRSTETGRPKDYGTLYKAFEVLAEYHQDKFSPETLHCNDDVIEALATEAGLAELPRLAPIDKPARVIRTASGAPAELDAFGSKLGSGAAAINAALSNAYKKMAQLMKDAGVDRSYYGHLKNLIAAGKVEKSPEGFRIKGGGQKK